MSLLSFLSGLFKDPNGMAPSDFLAQRDASSPVIDVRTPREHAQGHLVGSINVDIHQPDFARQMERLAKKGKIKPEEPVYLYCRSGARSGRATRILREMGFTEAYNVGGFGRLRAAGAKVRG
jgi:rhodanese-related sulfurtransferase